jgi:predicted nucleic acid-binding protein
MFCDTSTVAKYYANEAESGCLHIATAIQTGESEICTHDDHQAKAAEVLGLNVERIA